MQRRLKTVLLIVVVATAATLAFTSSWFKRAVVAANYERIGHNVYADPRLSSSDRQRALAQLQSARDRITAMFGTPVARPVTILAANDTEAAAMGLPDLVPGSAFITPFDTRVVLNMAHLSVDVTAHELMHAEVVERLGFWTRMVQLPVWFDEGLALQLDWRSGYQVDCAAVGPARVRSVRALVRASQFWDGGQEQIVANYKAAKCAAARVLESHPPRTLYGLLLRLRRGAGFIDLFATGTANHRP